MHKNWDQIKEDRLRAVIQKLFGDIDDHMYREIHGKLENIVIRDGEILMHQGEEGDSVYLVLSGRLRVYITHGNGDSETVANIYRGETVGEMSLLTGDHRSASVIAVRDTLLARLKRADFEEIISKHPQLVVNITRMIIERLKRMNEDRKLPTSVSTVTVVRSGIHADIEAFGKRLSDALSEDNSVAYLDGRDAYARVGIRDLTKIDDPGSDENQMMNTWLDGVESENDLVILIADEKNTPWTRRCVKQADILLTVAQAGHRPSLSDTEKALAVVSDSSISSRRYFVLLHDGDVFHHDMSDWLKGKKISGHFHVRKKNNEDLHRLGRFLSGTSNGLVLSGGGAKGIAHVGVLKALEEYNIHFDYVGGSSIGAVIGALAAKGLPAAEIAEQARVLLLSNPTPRREFNFFPLYSLFSGRRFDKLLKQVFGVVDIEDLPKEFFCVSSNISNSRLHVHQYGDLTNALRASASLPGIFPPIVHDRNVLVDGGIFNNLPVDVMNQKGVSRIIAVSVSKADEHVFEHDDLPNKYKVLAGRLLGAKRKMINLPTLMNTLVSSTTVNSDFREKELIPHTDLLFNPDVSAYNFTDWKAFDQIEKLGYEHACRVLDEEG